MKIEFDMDGVNQEMLYDIVDSVFVGMLKRQLKESQEFLISEHYRHPTDIEVAKDNIKACKVLLDYYCY
jgi:hypothetical protein